MTMIRQSIPFYLSLWFAIGILSGCGTIQGYAGPKLPRYSVATIMGSTGFGLGAVISGVGATIYSVDGNLIPFNRPIDVLPGLHVIEVTTYYSPNQGGMERPLQTLTVDTRAGYVYEVWSPGRGEITIKEKMINLEK